MKFNFTMGADPEFSLTILNKRLDAEQILPKYMEPKGCVREEMGYKVKGGEMGFDGCGATAEIRPLPSDNPLKVLENIKNILKETHNNMPLLDMITTNNLAPVGGHLHIVLPKGHSDDDSNIKDLINHLDLLFLPILMSEDKRSEKIRLNNEHYGKLHDYRVEDPNEDWNTETCKIEYRTPNAEWLTNQKVCQATLTYLAVCWDAITNHKDKTQKLKRLLLTDESSRSKIQHLILDTPRGHKINMDVLKELKPIIRKFPAYQEYKKDIEYILNPEKVFKDKERDNFNIITGWKFAKNTKLTESLIKKGEKIAQASLEALNIDEEQKENTIIPHNTDLNCQTFATKLGALMAANRIFKRHEYFIFGLKKGINNPIIMNQDKKFFHGTEQCFTQEDFSMIRATFQRMFEKCMNVNDELSVVSSKQKQILFIGLPYEIRLKNDFKSFLRIIKELEDQPRFKTQPTKFPSGSETTGKGKIWAIYNKDREKIVFDNHSQGRRFSIEAARNMGQ